MPYQPVVSVTLPPLLANVNFECDDKTFPLQVKVVVTFNSPNDAQRLRVDCFFEAADLPAGRRFIPASDQMLISAIQAHLTQSLPQSCEHLRIYYKDIARSALGTVTYKIHHRQNELIESLTAHDWIEIISRCTKNDS